MSLADYLILAGIGCLVGCAVGTLWNRRKKGSCNGDCSNCGGCHF